MNAYEYHLNGPDKQTIEQSKKKLPDGCCSLQKTHLRISTQRKAQNIQIALNSNENLWKLWKKVEHSYAYVFSPLEFHQKQLFF